MLPDTIFALSSGAPPAAIGVLRISGPAAAPALMALAGRLPEPRRASLARLRAADGTVLDDALILWFPGPDTATGEDLAELHCHGGRAVIAAVEQALHTQEGLRRAEPGEFTKRAFANGRIDLAEAEGLADLLSAETELQRAAALANASGALSRQIDGWRDTVLIASAQIEAALDFSDEEDAAELPGTFFATITRVSNELDEWLARPRSDRLNEGFRVVLAGPPNAGKSSLFNALIEAEAAITSPVAGTTRDVIERSVALSGVPFTFVDTAGLRAAEDIAIDPVEAIGIDRAKLEMERADLVLWLGEEDCGPVGAWEIAARCDLPDADAKHGAKFAVSAVTRAGLDDMKRALIDHARRLLPKPGEAALNVRQHALLHDAKSAISAALQGSDPLVIAEELRSARVAFDRLIGRSTTEDMLDALFGRFCIGK